MRNESQILQSLGLTRERVVAFFEAQNPDNRLRYDRSKLRVMKDRALEAKGKAGSSDEP